MDINTYLKNKDVTITNDDLDIEKLQNDARKGYVKKNELDNMVNKEDHNKIVNSYAELETNYNNTIKSLEAANSKNSALALEKEMMGAGFEEKDFEDISKLRTTLYADEKDNKAAVLAIKEKYKATYFPPMQPETPKVPNENGFKATGVGVEPPKITRKSTLSDFIIRK